jgi:hypothetical protein
MDGVLTTIKKYQSKTQTKYKGTVYKCIFKVENNGVLEDNWSLQCFPLMRNYKYWDAIVAAKENNPGKWVMVKNLKQLGARPKTLDADYWPNEDKPTIIDIIDNPNKGTPKNNTKVSNQFDNLFEKGEK